MKALKISKPIVLLLLTLALVSCKKDDEPQIPSVVTTSAINITSESVTCGGQIKSDGGEEIIEKGICISTTPKPTTAEGKIVSEETSDIFEFNIDRLSGSTKYYVRAFATNKIGTAYGSEVQFTTNAAILPTIETIPASEISYKKARLGVTATFDGGATISELGICYSTAENPTISNNKIMLSSGTGTKTAVISSFQANTTYYVKAYAINSVGTVYGEQISFTTLTPVIPSIGQFNIQNITLTKAIAFIRVNTDGGSDIIERGVCYSSIMINPTTSNSKVVSTGTTGEFTCNINNLATNTMYHARAYATNAVGTTYSSDIQFRTSATTIDDVDGNTYDVIEIGNQAWLKQNLKTTKYRNGETIGTTTVDITNENEPKYQWPATAFESNADTFGRVDTY